MHHTFGARLRSQREARQIPLSVIAEQSKIRVALLEGLERGDVSQWPGGIFRRSYVRNYAQAIGLDPDVVVREFLDLFPDPTDEDPATVIAAARGVAAKPPTRLGLLLGSAFDALHGQRNGTVPPAVAPPGVARGSEAPVVTPRPEHPAPLIEAQEHPVQLELPAHAEPHAPVLPALEQLAAACSRMARATCASTMADAFADGARAMEASGLILWLWDRGTRTLAPALAHGYADRILSRLPRVAARDDNPVASVFRDAAPQVIDAPEGGTGAVVVPVINCDGCVGVLALELHAAAERAPLVRAMASLLAAQLATLVSPLQTLQAATA